MQKWQKDRNYRKYENEDGSFRYVITIDGEDWILEKPLHADVALVYAHTADTAGNLIYKGSQANFNNVMAAAGKITIVETPNLVEAGTLDPNTIHTPGVFVNYIVHGGN